MTRYSISQLAHMDTATANVGGTPAIPAECPDHEAVYASRANRAATDKALAPFGVRNLQMPAMSVRVWRAIRDARV